MTPSPAKGIPYSVLNLFAGEGWGEGMEKSILKRYARSLRRNSTEAEKQLWYFIRAKRLGYKFKRQVPICGYIVDFVCFSKQLIIELDGGQHQMSKRYDVKRTAVLNARGFKVLRFWNHDVLQDTEAVLTVILKTLSPALPRE